MKSINQFKPTSYDTFKSSRTKKDADWEFECDDILTLDIEVSSGWIKDGVVIPYTKGETEKYWNELVPVSLCYIWQFSFNDEVYYGRNLEEFVEVLKKLPKDVHFIIWVHNLAYEFQFLNNYLQPWCDVFARNPHKPMKAVSGIFPNIEFRCSYFLTRLSLEKWGDSMKFPKLHTLDYNVLRTPNTPLTQPELDYCERDCEVVFKGISSYKKKYEHVFNIPLTQTGEVRRELKSRVCKDSNVQKHMVDLLPKNSYMYKIMVKTFQGGYTHANFTLAGMTLHDGTAFDFASSYPACMVSEKFPMGKFYESSFNINDVDEYAYLMCVKFTNVKAKTMNHYLSDSKSFDKSKCKLDNGRIISADYLSIWITEQDLDIILKTYECEYEVLECYKSKKGYLPKCIVEFVLELYGNKTTLKDVVGQEDIYAQSKQFINSLFGMCVTALINEDVNFNGDDWWIDPKTEDDVDAFLADLKKNNRKRTFLAYQFGPWITAYARHNLWECLLTCDEDVIYCDTDSLKIANKIDFTWYNDKIAAKMKEACDFHGLDFELTQPKDPKGRKRPLGLFLEEDEWSEFKTLGAKRYCYRTKDDGVLHLTVSGINKGAVACLNDDIENFNDETAFDKDNDSVTKKYSSYCNNQPTILWNEGKEDEYFSTAKYGINMRPTSYTMGITDEYMELIYALEEKQHLRCI